MSKRPVSTSRRPIPLEFRGCIADHRGHSWCAERLMYIDVDLIGYSAAMLTTSAFVPQAVKTIRSRDTRAISFWMYVAFTIGIALWFFYGVALGSWPVILSNMLTFLLSVTILVFKIRYG